MKTPAVCYGAHIYTSPMGHAEALALLVAAHGPKDAREFDEWVRACINSRAVRYGWLVNRAFTERID